MQSLSVSDAMDDLESYVERRGYSLSPDARAVFATAESFCSEFDVSPLEKHYLFACIREVGLLRSIVKKYGIDVQGALDAISENVQRESQNTSDYSCELPYSEPDPTKRRTASRHIIIDFAIKNASHRKNKIITAVDVVCAVLDTHNFTCPVIENGLWRDDKLHTPYNTLSHVLGHHTNSLWINFDTVRDELGAFSYLGDSDTPLNSAPQHIRHPLSKFLTDNPDFKKNGFLIMSFETTRLHNDIYAGLKEIAEAEGLYLHRADDKMYSEDLLTNIQTYIYGCYFAIAVFERISADVYNPNVSYEVGYCHGLGKPVCLLKDKTLPALQVDLVGKLYHPFDPQDVANTSKLGLRKWLSSHNIIELDT